MMDLVRCPVCQVMVPIGDACDPDDDQGSCPMTPCPGPPEGGDDDHS